MANLLKTEHYEVVMHAGDMEWVMPELVWHLEDLRVGQCYPNYYVSRLASKFVKVVLSGAGGDELFGGYPWRYYRGSQTAIRGVLPTATTTSGSGSSRTTRRSASSRRAAASSAITPRYDVFRGVFDGWPGRLDRREDYLNASLYFELKTFLHGLLVVEDKLSMAHSLETRVPFLDNELVDFALSLPVALKVPRSRRPWTSTRTRRASGCSTSASATTARPCCARR